MALIMMSCLFRRLKANSISLKGLISSIRTRQFKTVSSLRNVPSNMGGYFNTSEKGMLKLKNRDNIPDGYTLIYKTPMETTIRTAYPVITLCTVGALTSIILHYEDAAEIPKHNTRLKFLNPSNEIWFFFGGMVMLAVTGFAVIFKFPFRVYKHNSKKEYIALFLSAIPWKLSHFHFQKASLTKFKNPIYFFMTNCHYFIDNKRAFLLAHCFRKPVDLCEMEGSK